MSANTAARRMSFWYRNSLSLVILFFVIVFLLGQIFSGLREYNKRQEDNGGQPVSLPEYLTTAHFIEATFENWESEFLQMGMYVLLTVFLRQWGSSESKKLDGKEEVDRPPVPHKDAPWPVKRGGAWLSLYKNSLCLAFLVLFLASFTLHAYASHNSYNDEQALKGGRQETFFRYLGNSRLWFESFQNWQSEFVAVLSLVLLSIYLRQMGSPESKPVDAGHEETGK